MSWVLVWQIVLLSGWLTLCGVVLKGAGYGGRVAERNRGDNR